jgi:hypothetical protein
VQRHNVYKQLNYRDIQPAAGEFFPRGTESVNNVLRLIETDDQLSGGTPFLRAPEL